MNLSPERAPAPKLRYRAGWQLLAMLCLGVFLLLSLMPMPVIRITPMHSDKLLHALSYAFLMYAFAQVFDRIPRPVLALLFIVLGVGVEFLQGLTRYRSFEIADMAANGVGVVAGWLLVHTPAGRLLLRCDRLLGRFMDARGRR